MQGSITPRNHGNSESPGATLLSYYQSLESLGDVAAYIQERYCASDVADCKLSLKHLQAAESLDIDYDASSRNFILRAYQSRSPSASVGWSTSEQALEPGRTEIGVLAAGDATIRDHLKFGGYLVVLRDEKKLSIILSLSHTVSILINAEPTLFQFPSRHHGPPSLNSTYKISFPKPSGLHPTLQIEMNPGTLTRPRTTDPDSCTLHSYLTLPSAIFPDKYQLSNELLLQSLNIRRIQSISGYTDLEAPDYAVSSWGSSMLVELEVLSDETRKADNSWHANTPLHLRYLLPNNSKSGISSIEVPWPVVFWACTADDETGNFTRNPFDRTHLGYDVHFSEKTVFYHLQPESEDGRLMSILHVPVLNTGILGEDTRILELGTSFVVLTGWIWIVWLLFRGWWSTKSPIRGQKKMI